MIKLRKSIVLLSSCLVLSLPALSIADDSTNSATMSDNNSATQTAKLDYVVTGFNAAITSNSDNSYVITLSKLSPSGANYLSQSHTSDVGNLNYAEFAGMWHSKEANSFMNNHPNGRLTVSNGSDEDSVMSTIIGQITDVEYDASKQTLVITMSAFDDFALGDSSDATQNYDFASLFVDYTIGGI